MISIRRENSSVIIKIHPKFYGLDSDKAFNFQKDFIAKLKKEIESLNVDKYTITEQEAGIQCLETLAILEAPLLVDIKYLDNEYNEVVDSNKLIKDFVKKSNKLYMRFIEKMDKPIKEKADNILNSDNVKLVALDKSL